VAANSDGGYQAGMGVGFGDFDADGRFDVSVTNFYGESTSLFQNLGGMVFRERGAGIGLKDATRYRLGFGTVMADTNDDGLMDMFTANGHVNDVRPVIPYEMPSQLLRARAAFTMPRREPVRISGFRGWAGGSPWVIWIKTAVWTSSS